MLKLGNDYGKQINATSKFGKGNRRQIMLATERADQMTQNSYKK